MAHQAGTCRFGADPATSVLNTDCRAHELDNLYVVDTSFFPSIGAVNPALTAMANALRVGDHLLERLGAPAHGGRWQLSTTARTGRAPAVVIVGGGFGGLTAARELRRRRRGRDAGGPPQPPPVPAAALPAGVRGLSAGECATPIRAAVKRSHERERADGAAPPASTPSGAS